MLRFYLRHPSRPSPRPIRCARARAVLSCACAHCESSVRVPGTVARSGCREPRAGAYTHDTGAQGIRVFLFCSGETHFSNLKRAFHVMDRHAMGSLYSRFTRNIVHTGSQRRTCNRRRWASFRIVQYNSRMQITCCSATNRWSARSRVVLHPTQRRVARTTARARTHPGCTPPGRSAQARATCASLCSAYESSMCCRCAKRRRASCGDGGRCRTCEQSRRAVSRGVSAPRVGESSHGRTTYLRLGGLLAEQADGCGHGERDKRVDEGACEGGGELGLWLPFGCARRLDGR